MFLFSNESGRVAISIFYRDPRSELLRGHNKTKHKNDTGAARRQNESDPRSGERAPVMKVRYDTRECPLRGACAALIKAQVRYEALGPILANFRVCAVNFVRFNLFF